MSGRGGLAPHAGKDGRLHSGRGSPPDQETIAALNASYSVSGHRTVVQGPALGIGEIVDMALKAPSPGVNDTSTAVMSAGYLTAILARLAPRRFPAVRYYDGGERRVIAIAPTFESLLGSAFDQNRTSAGGNVAVISRMLGALDAIGSRTDAPRRRLAPHQEVQPIAELASRTVDSSHDRARLEARMMHVRNAAEAGPAAYAGEQDTVR